MTVAIERFSERWTAGWEDFVEAVPRATLAHADPWLSVTSRTLAHQDRSLVAQRGGEVSEIPPMTVLRHRLFGTFHVALLFSEGRSKRASRYDARRSAATLSIQ